jgi:hypothetical protein
MAGARSPNALSSNALSSKTLSPKALDAELTRHVEEQARVSDALLELERHRARSLLADGDPDAATLAALVTAVDARLATCTNDPLSLPARLPRDLVDGLDGGLEPIEARLAELTGVRDGWAGRRRAVADAVSALDPLWDQEAQARREALDRVAGAGLTPPADPRPGLHRRLGMLPAEQPDATALAAVSRLTADVTAAAQALHARIATATGLTERRAELAARFAAYRAKVLRLGVSADPQVAALAARVRALLAAPRTDLRTLTPALVAYQQRVIGLAEEGRSA